MQKIRKIVPYFVVAFLCGIITSVSLYLSSTLVNNYTGIITADMGISRTAFSLYSVIRSLTSVVLTMCVVPLLKHFKLKTVILAGIFSTAVNLLTLSFCKSVPQLYILAFVGGMAAFCSVVPVTMVVRNWFKKSYGTVLAIVLSASGIVGAIASPVIGLMTETMGWRMSFRVLAAVCAVICAVCFFFLHTAPQERGLLPFGAVSEDDVVMQENKKRSGKGIPLIGRSEDSRNIRALLVITAGYCLGGVGIFNATAAVVQSIGFPALFATGVAISCASISNCVGKIGMGWIGDHFGVGKMLILWYAICPIAMLFLLFVPAGSVPLAIVGVLLIGLTAGLYSVPMPIACTKLFKDKDSYLSAVSICTATSNLFTAFSAPICHGFYDRSGSYTGALLFSAVLGCISLVTVLALLRKNREAFFGK